MLTHAPLLLSAAHHWDADQSALSCAPSNPMKNVQTEDYRRSPRKSLPSSIFVETKIGRIQGYALDFGSEGLLVQAFSHPESFSLPVLNENCHVEIMTPEGTVEAEGQVVRVHLDQKRFALRLLRVQQRGDILLAYLL